MFILHLVASSCAAIVSDTFAPCLCFFPNLCSCQILLRLLFLLFLLLQAGRAETGLSKWWHRPQCLLMTWRVKLLPVFLFSVCSGAGAGAKPLESVQLISAYAIKKECERPESQKHVASCFTSNTYQQRGIQPCRLRYPLICVSAERGRISTSCLSWAVCTSLCCLNLTWVTL